MNYRLHPKASLDLEAIGDHIATDNPYAAARLMEKFARRWELLTLQPHSGVDRSDLAIGLRRLVIGEYLAPYRVSDIGVEIVRVLHGKRDFGPDDFPVCKPSRSRPAVSPKRFVSLNGP